MSEDDLLSQDEIDALLKGVSGDDDTAESSDGSGGKSRIQPFDPSTQKRVIRERLQSLEIINERFARQFRVGLFNLMRRSTDVTVESVEYQSYSEFSRNLPVPTNINVIAMKPLRGSGLIVFPPSMVFMVVDNLFGGDGRFVTKNEGREFTKTEQRIIQRLLDLAIECYSDAWKSVYPLDISFIRSEIQSKFANITNSPNEIVINTSFNLELGNLSSIFNICMPYAMVEPLRDLLAHPLSDSTPDEDRAWSDRFAKEIRQSAVELVANFTGAESRVGEVMSLKVGDVLPIELPETVTAKVDGVPVMECYYGSRNDRRALRVLRIFDHAAGHAPTDNFLQSARPSSKEPNHD